MPSAKLCYSKIQIYWLGWDNSHCKSFLLFTKGIVQGFLLWQACLTIFQWLLFYKTEFAGAVVFHKLSPLGPRDASRRICFTVYDNGFLRIWGKGTLVKASSGRLMARRPYIHLVGLKWGQGRTSYIICGAACKMKWWSDLFKRYSFSMTAADH